MSLRSVFRQPKIRSHIIPQPDATLRGDIHNGQPVYLETRPTLVLKPVIDPLTDKEMWIRNPVTNEPIRKRLAIVNEGDRVLAYVHQDLGNGIVKKNYDFELSEHDKMRAKNPVLDTAQMQESMKLMMQRISELEEQLNDPEIPADAVEVIADAQILEIEEEAAVPVAPKPKARARKKSGAKKTTSKS